MARGASSHFSLKRVEYDRYYPTVLGVLQNSGFLVLDAERTDDRAFLQGLPRTGEGAGIEIEIRRRPKGVDVHVLDRKSTRLNSSHVRISYAGFCFEKKKTSRVMLV